VPSHEGPGSLLISWRTSLSLDTWWFQTRPCDGVRRCCGPGVITRRWSESRPGPTHNSFTTRLKIASWVLRLHTVVRGTLVSGYRQWWLGVFIAPTTKPTVGEAVCRWAHRTVRCTTGHCSVRQPRHPTVRVLTVLTVGALTSWDTGQSGATPDRHCSLSGAPSGAALTLCELSAHCSCCR
jgi:hypothetical protein